MVDYQRINNTLGKMEYHLATHDSVCVSISGGSDSDTILHMIATYCRQYLDKVHFVFSNTGLEYQATLRHLDDLEKKYDVKIERIKGTPIPVAVKEHGVPFLSKQISEYMKRLQRHSFDWSDRSFEELYQIHPKCKVGLEWWCNAFGEGSHFNINQRRLLKEFLISNNPDFKISADCCKLSKKNPLIKYEKQIKADLVISGERKCEGGARAVAHNSCFGKRNDIDLYMPLFFWDDETKAYYKEHEGITYSDCYEVYGLKRTG